MSDTLTGSPALDAINAALATVQDPEINRPLTELGMVKDVQIADDGSVRVEVYLTVAGCPMRETITNRVTTASPPRCLLTSSASADADSSSRRRG